MRRDLFVVGASHHFRRGGDLAATLFRGRWSSVTTARGYLVEGLALLAQLTVNVRTVPRGVLYIETLRSALSTDSACEHIRNFCNRNHNYKYGFQVCFVLSTTAL